MIGLDTNIIIHYLVSSQPEHERVFGWLSKQRGPFATTHTNISETLRLLTHPRVFPKPLFLAKALHLVHSFIQTFELILLAPSEEWWLELEALLESVPSLKGNEIFDAQIALTFRYHGVKEIGTFDTDFAKYPFLKIVKF